MLRALFGSDEDTPQKKKPKPTKQDILFFARMNNALMAKGRIKKAKKS
jgi:hypothetical protein